MIIAINFDNLVFSHPGILQGNKLYGSPVLSSINSINYLLEKGQFVFVITNKNLQKVKKWLIAYTNPLLYVVGANFRKKLTLLMSGDMDLIETTYANPSILQYKVKIIPPWTRRWERSHLLGITNRKLPADIYLDADNPDYSDWGKILGELHDKIEYETYLKRVRQGNTS